MEIPVECVRDAKGDETPVRFALGNRHIAGAELLDRWYGSDHCYFKVRSADGALYILRHDETRAAWELTLFQRQDSRSLPSSPRYAPPGVRQ